MRAAKHAAHPLRTRPADPAPSVIRMLERIDFLLRVPPIEAALARVNDPDFAAHRDVLRPVLEELRALEDMQRREILDLVAPALGAWRKHENRDEVAELLGLRLAAKRRRTQHAVERDFAMALAMAEHRVRKTRGARPIVADTFGQSEREVSRACAEFGPVAEGWVRRIRQDNGGAPVALRGAPVKRDKK